MRSILVRAPPACVTERTRVQRETLGRWRGEAASVAGDGSYDGNDPGALGLHAIRNFRQQRYRGDRIRLQGAQRGSDAAFALPLIRQVAMGNQNRIDPAHGVERSVQGRRMRWQVIGIEYR